MTAAKPQLNVSNRLYPEREILDCLNDVFIPAVGMDIFVRETFFNESSILYNADHAHLVGAIIGYLWTNVENKRQMKAIAATAEIPKPPLAGNAWAKAKYRCQLREWFGTDRLDFLITIDARYAAECSDVHFCALLDHELYHCAQRLDEFGGPKFTKEGDPVFGILGHDVEEFVGIVRRYGAKAGAGATAELVVAGQNEPEIAEIDIQTVCGSCG